MLLHSCVSEKDVFDDDFTANSTNAVVTSSLTSFLNEEFFTDSVDS